MYREHVGVVLLVVKRGGWMGGGEGGEGEGRYS